MRLLFFLLCLLLGHQLLGQIGHTTITFNDPMRTGGFGSGGGPGRQIQTEIYYPASITGDNVPVLNGIYPVIVFGHGFVMTWDAYANIWEHYVALGYVLAFPRTEGGFSPNHGEFGKDLRIVETKLQALNTESSSLFYNKLVSNSAIIGHSMGGGATILAAANNSTIKAIVGLAPAETNPSAIAAAPIVITPALIISGSADGVTPPADHHIPIYNALPTNCKSFASITGGGHCYFANASSTCDLGELVSISNVTINRPTQHTRTFSILDPFLAYHLKGDCGAKDQFFAAMDISPSGFQNETTCVPNPIPVISQNGSTLSTATIGVSYQWLLNGSAINGAEMSSFTYTQDGQYIIEVTFEDGCVQQSAPYNIGQNALTVLDENTFRVFPNPTDGILVIENLSNNSNDVLIELYTLCGQILVRQKNDLNLDLSAFCEGFYLLNVNERTFRIQKK